MGHWIRVASDRCVRVGHGGTSVRSCRKIISLILYTVGDYVYHDIMLKCRVRCLMNPLYCTYCKLMVWSHKIDAHDYVWRTPELSDKQRQELMSHVGKAFGRDV